MARRVAIVGAALSDCGRVDDKTAYVSCDVSGQVAEISLTDWKVNRLIQAGKGVDGLAWAGE